MGEVPTVCTGDQNRGVEQKAALIDRAAQWGAPAKRGLCFQCRHGFITRRERDFDYKILCQQINQRMPDDIENCSKFQSSGQLTIWELVQLSEPFDVLTKKRAGFKQEQP